jgi:D-lactate dehydrogenase (cytochrome)
MPRPTPWMPWCGRRAPATSTARTQEERTAQWEARHQLYWATTHLYPGHIFTITDVAVPLSALPALIAETQTLIAQMALPATILGHVGDGNVHTLVATRPADLSRAQEFSAQIVQRALAVGGTASGEHGIGLAKRGFLAAEHGGAVEWMRRLKALFDPEGLLNPGKSESTKKSGVSRYLHVA